MMHYLSILSSFALLCHFYIPLGYKINGKSGGSVLECVENEVKTISDCSPCLSGLGECTHIAVLLPECLPECLPQLLWCLTNGACGCVDCLEDIKNAIEYCHNLPATTGATSTAAATTTVMETTTFVPPTTTMAPDPFLYPCTSNSDCLDLPQFGQECVEYGPPDTWLCNCICYSGDTTCSSNEECCSNACVGGKCSTTSLGTQGVLCGQCAQEFLDCAPGFYCQPWGVFGYCNSDSYLSARDKNISSETRMLPKHSDAPHTLKNKPSSLKTSLTVLKPKAVVNDIDCSHVTNPLAHCICEGINNVEACAECIPSLTDCLDAHGLDIVVCVGKAVCNCVGCPNVIASLAKKCKEGFDCSNKVDGTYTHATGVLSSVYYTCANHMAFKMHCGESEYFDHERKACFKF